MTSPIKDSSIEVLLRSLKLPGFVDNHKEVASQAEKEGWTYARYLRTLVEMEAEDRRRRRVERNLKASNLPPFKTLATFKLEIVPAKVRQQLPALCEGGFLSQGTNVLTFGLPGRGKTHLLCAIGYELVQRGHTVLFTPAYQLVQKLLLARRELKLERELRRLDHFDAIILDDLGYIQQEREEMEVLFTFFAERYERGSILISSNLVFSQWDKIFRDPMTTACAIDRVVHHSIILEMTGPSVRAEEARQRQADGLEVPQSALSEAPSASSGVGVVPQGP
jgi:DNA replication protein DnaC